MQLTTLIPPLMADSDQPAAFAPSKEMEAWMRETFLNDKSRFYNVAHDHLNSASLGVLWTNVPNSRQMKVIVGTAELGKPMGTMGKWAKARWHFQLLEWFGVDELDFLITLSAPFMAGCSEVEWYATCEHELYHCGQAEDEFGPKFHKNGTPVFGIRGHDVEEFVGVQERYGIGAGDTAALVRAAKKRPLFSGKSIAVHCGTC
jgi:hypothetical protein